MSAPQSLQPDPPPAVLKFACTHCRTSLEVPMALSGVSGPCPACGGEITAPVWKAASPGVNNVAQLLSKPPPLREMPPPMAPVEGPVFPAAPVEASRPAPRPVRAIQPLFPQRERGIFDDAPGDHQLDMHRRGPSFRRRGFQRWLDLGIVSVFTGLVLASVAALRYTEPVQDRAVAGLPANLTELARRDYANTELRGAEAANLAASTLKSYLGASEQTAPSYLLPPPEGIQNPPFPPPFDKPLSGTFAAQSSRRIPGTDHFVVTVKPKEEPGPVFVVEQTDNGLRLHAGPITQQSAKLYQKFLASLGEGEATLYTEMRPTHPDDERAFRTRFPDLSRLQVVDVRSAFPGDDMKPFRACLTPDSEAARAFARRSHDPSWRPTLAQFRWSRAPVGGPYVEVVKFIPATWSGERIMPPSANTAGLRP